MRRGRRDRLTGWLHTSTDSTGGYLGLRTASGQVIGVRHYGPLTGYQLPSIDIDLGQHSAVRVFADAWASGGDAWIPAD